jgi:hypothetical protein
VEKELGAEKAPKKQAFSRVPQLVGSHIIVLDLVLLCPNSA